MKLSDFSVGQRVALVRQSSVLPNWVNDRETWGIIKKIGKRYLHVALEGFDGWIIQFDSENAFRQKSDYSGEYVLFLDHQSVLDHWTRHYVIHKLRAQISKPTPTLTNDQIIFIAAALDIDPRGWVEEAPVYSAKEPRT